MMSRGPSSTFANAVAFPVPVVRYKMHADSLATGRVIVTRNISCCSRKNEVHHLEFSFMTSVFGKRDSVCASSPIPSNSKSKLWGWLSKYWCKILEYSSAATEGLL